MSTQPAHTARPSLLDRLTDWVLDHDGTIYGDERERLRWYEGIAVAATLQWIAIPAALAVLTWVGGRPVAPYLVAVFVVFYLPLLVVSAYVARQRVPTVPHRPSRKWVGVAFVAALPYLAFGVALVRSYGVAEDRTALLGGLVGAVAGGGLAVLALLAQRRRERLREDDDGPVG